MVATSASARCLPISYLQANWITVSVWDTAGVPVVVLNVTVADRTLPDLFAFTAIPADSLPEPDAAVTVIQSGMPVTVQLVFDVTATFVVVGSALAAAPRYIKDDDNDNIGAALPA